MEEKNPVLLLNDIRKDCVYEVVEDEDADLETRFTYTLTIDGKTFQGIGPNKKEAKANAARKALKHPAVNPNYTQYRATIRQQQKTKNSAHKQQQPSSASNKQQQSSNFNNRQQQSSNASNRQQQNYGKKMNKQSTNVQQVKDMLLQQIKDNSSFIYINGRQICRPYLNGLCMRGRTCPFYHPEYASQVEPSPMPPSPQQTPKGDTYMWLQFCQNYSYLRCPLSSCKFLHVSKEDEEQYHMTGRVPTHLIDQAIRKAILDDMAPAGVILPCKSFLDGQCNWYSCPFRHVSRQEFALEVTELLHKQFNKNLKPTSEYRLMGNRHSNRDMYGPGSQMMPDKGYPQSRQEHYNQTLYERPLQSRQDHFTQPMYERQQGRQQDQYRLSMNDRPEQYRSSVHDRQDQYRPSIHDRPDQYHPSMHERPDQYRPPAHERPDQYRPPMHDRSDQYRPSVHDRLGEDYLVSGMANLMRDPGYDMNQREINKLKDELKMLNEENEKLKNRMVSLEEEKHRNMQRHHNDRSELEAMRLLGGNQYMVPQPQHMAAGNMLHGQTYHPNALQRPQMMADHPTYNFDQLLHTMQRKGHLQQQQHNQRIGMTGAAKKNMPQGFRQTVGAGQQQKGMNKQKPAFKVPTKKSGQPIQSTVKATTTKKYFQRQNKKPKQQQQQQKQNQVKQNQNEGQQQKQNQANKQNKNEPKPQRQKNEKENSEESGQAQSLETDRDPETLSSKPTDSKDSETEGNKEINDTVVDIEKKDQEEEGEEPTDETEEEDERSDEKEEEEEKEKSEEEEVCNEDEEKESVDKSVKSESWADAVEISS